MVKVIEYGYDDYVEAMRSSLLQQGWPIDDVEDLAASLAELADSMSEGTVLGRLGDDILVRWLPHAATGDLPEPATPA